jgi:alkylated DNA repair dioxygenase AlkB
MFATLIASVAPVCTSASALPLVAGDTTSSSVIDKMTITQPKELTSLGVECYYIENFLDEKEADHYLERLLKNYPFHQEETTMMIGGKKQTFKQPRLTRLMGDKGSSFNYSGHVRPGVEWILEVSELRKQLAEVVKKLKAQHPAFNVVLGNLYKNGDNYIAFHSDDESEHNKDCFIASISLGAARDFVLKDKTGKTVHSILLKHGSLFIMGKDFQKKLKHGVPKRLRVKDPRINLTFRVMGMGPLRSP